MGTRFELHPAVKLMWELEQYKREGMEHIYAMLQAEEDYRANRKPLEETIATFFDHFFPILHFINSTNRQSGKIEKQLSAEVLTVDSLPRFFQHHAMNKRVATFFPTTEVFCAIFNPDVGLSLAGDDIFSPKNLTPAMNLLLDRPDVSITSLMFGQEQASYHAWIPPEKLIASIDEIANEAIKTFVEQAGRQQPDTDTTVFFLGIPPWENVEPAGTTFVNVCSEIVQNNFDARFWGKRVIINTNHFPGRAALIYGGSGDQQFPIPAYLTLSQGRIFSLN